MTLVIAHRGASAAEPENTIGAFRRAVEMGTDGIELDVRRSLDDHLIVHHDSFLADGRLIRSTHSSDIPAGVCELGPALDACAGAFVNIEIKNIPDEPDFDPSHWLAHRVTAELARRGDESRWLVSSFMPKTMRIVKSVSPRLRTALLTYPCDQENVIRAVRDRHVAIHPWEATLDEPSVRLAHRFGLAVNIWTCNDPDRIRELMAWGVDGICTDVPDVALSVRRGESGV